MILMVSGYRNISTGTAQVIIASRPKLDTTNENTVKIITQVFLLMKLGNIVENISEQLTTSASAVLRQARVTVASKKYMPKRPK